MSLERLDDARDALEKYVEEGGAVDAGVQKVRQTISEKIQYRDKIRAERAERERRQRGHDEALSQAIHVSSVPKRLQKILTYAHHITFPLDFAASATQEMDPSFF
jgi:hypothetical protein